MGGGNRMRRFLCLLLGHKYPTYLWPLPRYCLHAPEGTDRCRRCGQRVPLPYTPPPGLGARPTPSCLSEPLAGVTQTGKAR